MVKEPFNAVILILTILILLLLFVVVKINIQHYKDKKTFKKKIKFLKVIFFHTNMNKFEQLDKIKLSEELKNNIATINTNLGLAIFDLNKEMFKIISKNNLA